MTCREQLIHSPIAGLHQLLHGNTPPLGQQGKTAGTNTFFDVPLLEVAQSGLAAFGKAQASGIGLH
tara:strand:- start:4 stop:201 length:198 start_codon:yes stop_codon:yes gene_type:complete